MQEFLYLFFILLFLRKVFLRGCLLFKISWGVFVSVVIAYFPTLMRLSVHEGNTGMKNCNYKGRQNKKGYNNS